MKFLNCIVSGLILFTAVSGCQSQSEGSKSKGLPMDEMVKNGSQTEVAVFGAGCFWCVEAVFQELNGVILVESGYMGGEVENPTYKAVCSGTTGHAEVARITFDPSIISYPELLEVLWTTHDPTTMNKQGADVGTQYRSAVFYMNERQRTEAEKSKAEVATKIWDKPIVTEITAASTFYKAEDYHQNYYALNEGAGYCQFVISPKILKVREKFASKLKTK